MTHRVGWEKLIFASSYVPGSEKVKIRQRFWKDLTNWREGFTSNERIVVFGYLNAKLLEVSIYHLINSISIVRGVKCQA